MEYLALHDLTYSVCENLAPIQVQSNDLEGLFVLVHPIWATTTHPVKTCALVRRSSALHRQHA